MCIANIPNLLYYAYLPSVGAGLLFGFFIYFQNRSSMLNKLLTAIVTIFTLYVVVDFLTWFPTDIKIYEIFQRMLMLILILLPLFIYFAYELVVIKTSKAKRLVIWFPFIVIVVMTFSRYSYLLFSIHQNNTPADLSCDVNFGMFFNLIFLIAGVYIFWFIAILIKQYRKSETASEIKSRIKIVIVATVFLIIWIAFLIWLTDFSGNYDLLLLIPLGMVIFIGMLAYAITKYHLMNIKLLFAQAIVIGLTFFLAAELFFAESATNRVLILITLFISIGLGYMLVKSVKSEIKQREDVEAANKIIAIANREIEQKNEKLETANEEISKQKNSLQKLSDSLKEANVQLKQLDQVKNDFINFASHQLRTPITGIKGFASLLAEGSYGELEPKQKDAAEKIGIITERMASLVEDFLNASKIESGGMKYEFDKWKIEDICQEVVTTLLPKASDKNFYLKYEKPEMDLPELLIDGPKVKETISNLVDNAIKYTKEGGVTVHLELTKNQQLTTKDKMVIRVTVSDTGIGIPPNELPLLFAKFSRGRDTKRLNATGTGLGLYVGKTMVEAQGGKVWAESDGEGKGSKFIAEFPIETPKEILEKISQPASRVF